MYTNCELIKEKLIYAIIVLVTAILIATTGKIIGIEFQYGVIEYIYLLFYDIMLHVIEHYPMETKSLFS
jgi:hypothetical protein